jgi:nitrite reductase/ring-hydroxylating ferredoxin subunit
LVFKVEGRAKAVLSICTHLGGPLERYGDKLVCEWHGEREPTSARRYGSTGMLKN